MSEPSVIDETSAPISALLQRFCDEDWAWKEHGASTDAHFDITPIVRVVDAQDNLLLTFVCQRMDKRDAIAAATIMCRMVPGVDRLVVSLDAHVSSDPVNPATGRKWEPGEMQRACDEDGACSLGVITDTIVTHEFRTDGTTQMVNRLYHVHENEAGGTIGWVKTVSVDERQGGTLQGRIVDGLRAAIADRNTMTPTEVVEEARKLGGPTDPVEVAVHHRLGATKFLAVTLGGAVFPNFPEDVAAQYGDLITDSLSDEAVQEFSESPAGQLVPLLRARFGLDMPLEDW